MEQYLFFTKKTHAKTSTMKMDAYTTPDPPPSNCDHLNKHNHHECFVGDAVLPSITDYPWRPKKPWKHEGFNP